MKMIKKSIVVLMMILVALTAFAVKSSATTKDELKEYMLSEKVVAGQKLIIREADKVKVERFFKENEVTDEQAGQIKEKIDKIIALMTADGATHPNAISSKAKKQEALGLAKEAAAVVGYTVSYDATEERLDIYKDGKFVDSLNWGEALVQTGSTNYAYIAIAGVVLFAGITVFVARKNALKANA